MKIIVCIKAIPRNITAVNVASGGQRLIYQSWGVYVNESDEYALEEALAMKLRYKGTVTAITVGPLDAQEVLHKAIAKGVDKVIRVDAESFDAQVTAALLAESIKEEGGELILTGSESEDVMAAQVGVSVAARLNIPFAYGVTRIESSSPGQSVSVTKEVGGGVQHVLEMYLPALCCIQPQTRPLANAPLALLLRARRSSIKVIKTADWGCQVSIPSSRWRFQCIYVPQREERQIEYLKGTIAEIAQRLVTIIGGAT